MEHSKKKWMGIAGALVVSGILLVAGLGSPGAQTTGNPLNEILDKLNQILTAINGIQQSNSTLRWDQNLPSAQRFVILAAFNNQAVLDKNTGLVWEQAPEDSPVTWAEASVFCIGRTVGGTAGWRLPSVMELRSVQDPALPAPKVPISIFRDIRLELYWSATSLADAPTRAYAVPFIGGDPNTDPKGNHHHVWCVRGPMQEFVY